MTRLIYRKLRIFGGIGRVLIHFMAMLLLLSTFTVHTAVCAEENAKLSKKEKQKLVEQGVDQYNNGLHAQAKETLRKAKETFPENFAIPYYLGLIYLEEGNRSDAIAEWRQYVAMDPKSENAMRIRKELTLLLRKEAREYARYAIANEADLLSGQVVENAVAVTSFHNLGSEELGHLGKGMAAMVIHDLSQIPDLRVVERIKLQVLLDEMELGTSGLVDEQTAPRVGKLLKSKHVTSGSLADLEKETLQIASVVMDTDRSIAIGTQEAQGALKKFYKLEKEIACGIITDLGKDCKKAPGAFGKIHTKSLPALAAFSEGLDYFDQEKYDEAREMYQKALEEDPEFDLAHKALIATPVSAMLLMTTPQIISSASSSGVSSVAAGSAVASTAAAGGVGVGAVTAAVGSVAVVGGVAAVASSSGGGGGGNDEPSQSVEGRWRGTWSIPGGSEGETTGEITLILTQTDSAVTGNASITGSSCISTGNVTGTITGNTVQLDIVSSADSVVFNATYNAAAKTMNGNFEGLSGDCAGVSGTFSTTLTGSAEISW